MEEKRSNFTEVSRSFLDSILNLTGDPLFVKNNNHEFVVVNDAYCAITGFSRDVIIGSTMSEMFPANQMKHFFGIDRMVLESGVENSCEEFLTINDGSTLIMSTKKTRYVDENGNFFLIGIMHDITMRRKNEEEIKSQNAKLQKINREKDKFFSIISHDLKSPFNGFLGLTEILLEDLPSLSFEEIQDIVSALKTSATNLYRLLENLLEWSRFKNGILIFNPENLLIYNEIDDYLKSIIDLGNKKWIEIKVNVPEDFTIFADRNMFRSIIQNLVSNAVKFTKKRGAITVSATRTDGFVVFSVRDTGIGMKSEIVENLFKLDLQTSRVGTEGELSTGLGLILCKDFIEKHKGKIWVESKENIGSDFQFTLPCCEQ